MYLKLSSHLIKARKFFMSFIVVIPTNCLCFRIDKVLIKLCATMFFLISSDFLMTDAVSFISINENVYLYVRA